jgi:Uncharacterised protein family (UPF0259)
MATAVTTEGDRNRVLGFGEILSRSLALIVSHLGLVAAITIPYWICPIVRQWADEVPGAGAIWLVAFVVDFLLVHPLVDAALIYAVARCYAGRKVSLRDAYSRAVRMFPLVVANYFLVYVAVTLGLVLLIVPGVVLILWFSFTGVIVVLEGLGAVPALKRGYEMTKGSLRTAGAYLVVMLVIGCLTGVETGLIPSGVPKVLLGAALEVVGAILNVVFATLFYFSCRVKMAQLNAPAPVDATSGAVAAT